MSDTNTTAPTSPMPSYVASLLRTVGAVLGGYLIEKGFISAHKRRNSAGPSWRSSSSRGPSYRSTTPTRPDRRQGHVIVA
jgi:hypothetical protein